MGKIVTYGINYNGSYLEVMAATFYSACRKAILKAGVKSGTKFYVGRLIDTSSKSKKLTDYLITTDKNEIIQWLKNRYAAVSNVNKAYGWVMKGGKEALNLKDCIDNISENIGEPSVVEVADYYGRYYKDKFSFDVIALK